MSNAEGRFIACPGFSPSLHQLSLLTFADWTAAADRAAVVSYNDRDMNDCEHDEPCTGFVSEFLCFENF